MTASTVIRCTNMAKLNKRYVFGCYQPILTILFDRECFLTPPIWFESRHVASAFCIHSQCTQVFAYITHDSHCIHSERSIHYYIFIVFSPSYFSFLFLSFFGFHKMPSSSVWRKYGIIISHMRVWSRKVYVKRIYNVLYEVTRQKERKIKSTQKPSLRSAAFFLVLYFFLLVFHRPPITLNEPCENHGNPKNKNTHTPNT